jgi:hypothetical protein
MFLIYELTPLSKNYANAAEDAQQFFVTLSIQADDLNAKMKSYADRMGRITK